MCDSMPILADDFNYNDINLDFLESPTKNKPNVTTQDDAPFLAELKTTCNKTTFLNDIETTLPKYNNYRKLNSVQEISKRIVDIDTLVRRVRQVENERDELQKQLGSLHQSATEVQQLYSNEKKQRIQLQLKTKELEQKCENLDRDLVTKTLQIDQMQAQLDNCKFPIEYNELVVRYLKFTQRCEEERVCNWHDQTVTKELMKYCKEKGIKVATPKSRSPRKRKNSTNKIDIEIQCNILLPTPIEAMEKPSCRERSTQYEKITTRSQGCQHIGTTTTRGTTTSCFFKYHDVGTNCNNLVLESTLTNILEEFRPRNQYITPLSPISELELNWNNNSNRFEALTSNSPKPSTSKACFSTAVTTATNTDTDFQMILPLKVTQEYKNVGTCTYICNIQRAIDFVTQPITIKRSESRPPSSLSYDSFKFENNTNSIGTASASTTRVQETAERATSIHMSSTNNQLPTLPHSLLPNAFDELWQIIGHMFYGFLHRRLINEVPVINDTAAGSANNNNVINQQDFYNWLHAFYRDSQNDNSILTEHQMTNISSRHNELPANVEQAPATVRNNCNSINQQNDFVSPLNFSDVAPMALNNSGTPSVTQGLVKPKAQRSSNQDVTTGVDDIIKLVEHQSIATSPICCIISSPLSYETDLLSDENNQLMIRNKRDKLITADNEKSQLSAFHSLKRKASKIDIVENVKKIKGKFKSNSSEQFPSDKSQRCKNNIVIKKQKKSQITKSQRKQCMKLMQDDVSENAVDFLTKISSFINCPKAAENQSKLAKHTSSRKESIGEGGKELIADHTSGSKENTKESLLIGKETIVKSILRGKDSINRYEAIEEKCFNWEDSTNESSLYSTQSITGNATKSEETIKNIPLNMKECITESPYQTKESTNISELDGEKTRKENSSHIIANLRDCLIVKSILNKSENIKNVGTHKSESIKENSSEREENIKQQSSPNQFDRKQNSFNRTDNIIESTLNCNKIVNKEISCEDENTKESASNRKVNTAKNFFIRSIKDSVCLKKNLSNDAKIENSYLNAKCQRKISLVALNYKLFGSDSDGSDNEEQRKNRDPTTSEVKGNCDVKESETEENFTKKKLTREKNKTYKKFDSNLNDFNKGNLTVDQKEEQALNVIPLKNLRSLPFSETFHKKFPLNTPLEEDLALTSSDSEDRDEGMESQIFDSLKKQHSIKFKYDSNNVKINKSNKVVFNESKSIKTASRDLNTTQLNFNVFENVTSDESDLIISCDDLEDEEKHQKVDTKSMVMPKKRGRKRKSELMATSLNTVTNHLLPCKRSARLISKHNLKDTQNCDRDYQNVSPILECIGKYTNSLHHKEKQLRSTRSEYDEKISSKYNQSYNNDDKKLSPFLECIGKYTKTLPYREKQMRSTNQINDEKSSSTSNCLKTNSTKEKSKTIYNLGYFKEQNFEETKDNNDFMEEDKKDVTYSSSFLESELRFNTSQKYTTGTFFANRNEIASPFIVQKDITSSSSSKCATIFSTLQKNSNSPSSILQKDTTKDLNVFKNDINQTEVISHTNEASKKCSYIEDDSCLTISSEIKCSNLIRDKICIEMSPASPTPMDMAIDSFELETKEIPLNMKDKCNLKNPWRRRRSHLTLLQSLSLSIKKNSYRSFSSTHISANDLALIKQIEVLFIEFMKTNNTEESLNFSLDDKDIDQLIEKIYSLTDNLKSIAHAIIGYVRKISRPCLKNYKNTSVTSITTNVLESAITTTFYDSQLKQRFLTQQHQSISRILIKLQQQKSEIVTILLNAIESMLFNLENSEKISLNILLNLTDFYTNIIKQQSIFEMSLNPARLFIAKCFYYHKVRAPPMIYTILSAFPTTLPHREERRYDRSDPLITVLQHLLMNCTYDMNNFELKHRELLSKLRFEYHFEPFKPDFLEVLTNLVEKLKANKRNNLVYAFAIFCKRLKPERVIRDIVNEHFIPLSNEYYKFVQQNSEYDDHIALLLDCFSSVIKPLPRECDNLDGFNISNILSIFQRFLYIVKRSTVQEAALRAILRLQRFDFVGCYKSLIDYQPIYDLSPYTYAALKTFIHRKSSSFWENFFNSYVENIK